VTRALWTIAAATGVLLAASARARANVALAWRSPVVFWLAITLLAGWLSLGPEPQSLGRSLNAPSLYAPLYHHVPGFDGLRVPARFAVLVMLGVSLLAAYGARDLARRGGAWRAGLPLLGLLFLAESTAAPLPVNLTTADQGLPPPARVYPLAEAPALYRYVAGLPQDAVLVELPFGDTSWELQYVYYSTVHWRPLLNGYSGGFPASYLTLRSYLANPRRDPDAAWQALADSDATHLVLHEHAFAAGELAFLRAWLDGHGAAPLSRFGPSVVYALSR
jgi:hypothetical protein